MTIDPNWFYLRNPFDNTTKGNFKRMMLLARDHHDKLEGAAIGDPFIAALLLAINPAYNAFNNALQNTNISGDKRQSLTYQLEKLFAEQSSQIEDWDIRMSFKFRPSTVEYRYLMGDGRTSFYLGTYEGRLSTVRMLSSKLADYPSLADVKTDVDAWLANAESIRTLQQGEEGRQQKAQKEIERARVALAQKMHFVFASLLVKYYEDPIEVENFYELKYFQRGSTKKPDTTTGGTGNAANFTTAKITANSRKTVLKGTFNDTDAFEVKNTGNAAISIWLSNNESGQTPSDASTVAPGDTTTFYGDELSDGSASLLFLIVENSDSVDTNIEIARIIV